MLQENRYSKSHYYEEPVLTIDMPMSAETKTRDVCVEQPVDECR